MALIHTHFFSNVLGLNTTCEVILPEMAAAKPRQELKVLYLLHGNGGDETTWQRSTAVERYAEQYGVAVVMPAVEAMSEYCDLAHGRQFYSFVAKELPEVISGFFGFSAARENNAICGFSMGGAGALKIGLASPERFFAIGCLSSCIRLAPLPTDTKNLTGRAYILYDRKNLPGSEEDVEGNAAKAVSCPPRIFHRVGQSDFLLDKARETAAFFHSFEGNPFRYTYEEAPGNHDMAFADESLEKFFSFAFTKE